ncbi:MAG: heme NO-binding domain-containing protein [Ktedonobacteraceae bacterium]|nr:heme NO-binding domain-containing protein [Ktedonobacteraceae bacterium]MBO0795864.1 heme NO-binding domain-containing protein [Ktedonobacteraceae bacterium]
MKGIIFVVWEKYFAERFGSRMLASYREALNETPDKLPLVGKTYPDEWLVQGLNIASSLTSVSEDRLLIEYGRYFMLDNLVEHLCGYLLAQAWTGYDLLLLMRDAHAQMRRTPDGLMPPLFNYEFLSKDRHHMMLTYDSHRHLCALLEGCIYGAAERFGERAYVHEHTCQKRGDAVCRFEVRFTGESWAKRATPQKIKQEKDRLSKRKLSDLILSTLTTDQASSLTLADIQHAVEQRQGPYFPEIYQKQHTSGPVHVLQIHNELARLQQVGLVSSTLNQMGDTLESRRYWRSPTRD